MCEIKIIKHKNRHEITATLDVYFFEDGGYIVAYNPSLEIMAYGNNKDDARSEFTEILRLHFEECIDMGTLYDDLKSHGWKEKGERMHSPDFYTQLKTSGTLKDVVSGARDYSRSTYPLTMCV